MKEIALFALLLIIVICLIAIVYYFFRSSKNKETKVLFVDEPQIKSLETSSAVPLNPGIIPNDVVFDDRNLPVRTTRSRKKKIN